MHFVVWLWIDAGKMREMSEVGRQNCFALCLCDEERYERTLNALRCLAVNQNKTPNVLRCLAGYCDGTGNFFEICPVYCNKKVHERVNFHGL